MKPGDIFIGNITHKIFVVLTPNEWNKQKEKIEERGEEFYSWDKRPEGYIPARELGTDNYVPKNHTGIEVIKEPRKLLEDSLDSKVKADLRRILDKTPSLDAFFEN